MAFHPLRTFRKNQKTWLAALTILSMFSFVVLGSMSGTVDYFAHVFGGTRGTPVIVVHGKAVDFNELQYLRLRRDAINNFMANAVAIAKEQAFQQVQSDAKDWKDPQAQQQMMQILIARYQALGGSMGGEGAMSVEQRLGALNQAYNLVLSMQFGAKARNNSKEAEDLDTLAQVLMRDYRDVVRPKGDVYFGGKLDTLGLADFVLMREQADRLGISLNDDGVNQLVRHDTMSMLSPEQLQMLTARVRQNYGRSFRPEDWNAALRDEYRVRLARQALLGYDPDRPTPGYEMGVAVPLVGHQALTPYALWQDYRQARGERRIDLLPIPVDNKKFLDQVPAPKQAELVAFFEKYKNKPVNPNAAESGFMVPEQYAIEWIGARKDAPYFANKAEAQLRAKVAMVIATANQGLTPLLTDADLANWASKLSSVKLDRDEFNKLWEDASFFDKVHSTSVPAAPVDTAAAVAAAVGHAAVPTAAPLVGVAAYESSLAGNRLERAMLPAFDAALVGLASTPHAGWLPAATWLRYTDANKRYLPEDVALARVYQEVRNDVASNLVRETLDSLQEELQSRSSLVSASAGADFRRLYEPKTGQVPCVADLVLAQLGSTSPTGAMTAAVLAAPAARQYPATVQGRSRLAGQMLAAATNPFMLLGVTAHELSPDVALMRQPIEQAVRTYGLDHAAMPTPIDRFQLADAKPLARLKEAIDSASPESMTAANRNTQFMNTLVGNPDQTPQGNLYSPRRTGSQDNEEFLYWNTGFVNRRVPNYAEVKAEVKARWTFDKAREFARKAAEQVASEVARNKGPAADGRAELQKLAGSQELITLEGVAKLARSAFPAAMASSTAPYQAYQVPASTGVTPSPDFVTKLLTLKELGDTTVVHDAAESTYYVAVLEQRQLPSEQQFTGDYASPSTHGQLVTLVDGEAEAERTHLTALLETLRQQAGLQITDQGKDAFKTGRQ